MKIPRTLHRAESFPPLNRGRIFSLPRRIITAAILVLAVAASRVDAQSPATSAKPKRPHCEIVLYYPSGFQDHLSFFDANGREIKRVAASQENSKPDRNGMVRGHSVEFRGCKTGEFAAIVDRKGEASDDEGGDEESFVRSTDTVALYSSNGQRIWKKKIPPLKSNFEMQMSADDRLLWFTAGADTSTTILVALDHDGAEHVFPFPAADNNNLYALNISPSGRYAAVMISGGGMKTRIVFVDLLSGKRHEYIGDGSSRLSDDGLVEVLMLDQSGRSGGPPPKIVHSYKFE